MPIPSGQTAFSGELTFEINMTTPGWLDAYLMNGADYLMKLFNESLYTGCRLPSRNTSNFVFSSVPCPLAMSISDPNFTLVLVACNLGADALCSMSGRIEKGPPPPNSFQLALIALTCLIVLTSIAMLIYYFKMRPNDYESLQSE